MVSAPAPQPRASSPQVRLDVAHVPGAVTLIGRPPGHHLGGAGLVAMAGFRDRAAAVEALLRRALALDEETG